MTVKRYVNGAWQWHIERMIGRGIPNSTAFNSNLAANGEFLTDSCVYGKNKYPAAEDYIVHTPFETNIGGVISNWLGLSHLQGFAVVGTADSADGIFALPATVVNSSNLSLAAPYPPDYAAMIYNLSVGLPFTSYVETVRVDAGSQVGTAQGAIKRIHEIEVRLFRTLAAKVGPTTSILESLPFTSSAGYKSPELFTGDQRVKPSSDWDRDGTLVVMSDSPLPLEVVAIVMEGNTSD